MYISLSAFIWGWGLGIPRPHYPRLIAFVGAYLNWLNPSVSDVLRANAENSFVFQNPFLMNSTFSSSSSCLLVFSVPQPLNFYLPTPLLIVLSAVFYWSNAIASNV